LRQPSSTSQTDKTKTNDENHIDPLVENLDLSLLGEGLERALTEQRAPSPTKPEPPSPRGSGETEAQGRTRRNTMAVMLEQLGVRSSETTRILNPEQMRQIIASLSGGTRNRKAKEPEVYQGGPHKL